MNIDYEQIPTPYYLCDKDRLVHNLNIINQVQKEAGCDILLALKAFAMFSMFPLMKEILKGTAASSLNEARLGYEKFGGMVHFYAPAFIEHQFDELLEYCDYLVFNSFSQWKSLKPRLANFKKTVECGIRVNPEFSVVKKDIYDPCAKFSRLGVVSKEFQINELEGLTGLHFHTHCANNSCDLERTLGVIEDKFGEAIFRLKWVNFGGGQQITAKDYDLQKLCTIITRFKNKYDVKVFLEPGEAIAFQAGVLVTTVLDVIKNDINIVILDSSGTAHMPDTLEMPYQPEVIGASISKKHDHLYRLTGLTCLAGDVIGDYYFKDPLKKGSKIVFKDMLHYTMVKNTMFNGVELPSIASWSKTEGIKLIKKFGYDDYKNRLS